MAPQDTEKSIFNIKSVSEELETLAKDIAAGRLRIDEHHISISDPIVFKSKKKLKKGKVHFELTFEASLTGETITEDRQTSVPRKTQPSLRRKTSPKKKAGSSKKAVKKDITRLWKTFSAAIKGKRLPATSDVEILFNLMVEYTPSSDSPWHSDWLTCISDIKKCLSAAKAGNFGKAIERINRINLSKKHCHKLYK